MRRTLDARRFRPNILIQSEGADAFTEDSLVGCVLRIGSMRMRVDERDSRCAVITIEPGTGVRNANILRFVAKEREGCMGVYGSIVTPGTITLNDQVILENSDSLGQ